MKDSLESAHSNLLAADKNVAAIVTDLSNQISAGYMTTSQVIQLTALQIRLAEAWTRLAQEQREQRERQR